MCKFGENLNYTIVIHNYVCYNIVIGKFSTVKTSYNFVKK